MRKIILAGVVATVCGASSLSYAGMTLRTPVLIDDPGPNILKSAQGGIAGAANAPDPSDFIGCGFTLAETPNGQPINQAVTIACSATANGVTRTCLNFNPNFTMVAAVASIKRTSHILFYFDDSARCVMIAVDQSSYLIP